MGANAKEFLRMREMEGERFDSPTIYEVTNTVQLLLPYKLRSYGKAFFWGSKGMIPQSVCKIEKEFFVNGKGHFTLMRVQKWYYDKNSLKLKTHKV